MNGLQATAGNRATARALLGPDVHGQASGAGSPRTPGVVAHPGLAAARHMQLKRFEFDSYQLDSDDLDGFRRWSEGMGRVNPARLVSMIAFLFANGPGVDRSRLITMIEIAYAGTGHPIPAPQDTIDGPYRAVLEGLDELGKQVTKYDRVRSTIIAAALIDANADRIAAFRGHARYAVLELVREQPSSGFDNESAGAIRERTGVLLAAWEGLTTSGEQIDFFNRGFGNDPCIAARLNGVAEYHARALGISEEALSGATYDSALGGEILRLAYEYLDDDQPDWGAFLVILERDHADVFTHPAFHATYPVAKSGFV